MVAESTPPPQQERYLSLGAVAGRFLTRIENVHKWVAEGKLKAEPDSRGRLRIPESSVLAFQEQAFRRENFPGLDHGERSWPSRRPAGQNLPVPVETERERELAVQRWPYPHGRLTP